MIEIDFINNRIKGFAKAVDIKNKGLIRASMENDKNE
jgi:hypothetical protein